jgi:hypothetical protein
LTQPAQDPEPKVSVVAAGTKSDPWRLETASRTTSFEAYCDLTSEPPSLVCRSDVNIAHYRLRGLGDLYRMLQSRGDWMDLGNADEKGRPAIDTIEAWARSSENPVGGWYGLKRGWRGRFAHFVPPVLEHLGYIELEHGLTNNRARALAPPGGQVPEVLASAGLTD